MAPRTLLLSLALVAFSGFGLAYGDPTTETDPECTVDPTDDYPTYPEVYSTWSSEKAAATDPASEPECETESASPEPTSVPGGYDSKSGGPGPYSGPTVTSTADPVTATPISGSPYYDGGISGSDPVATSTCTEEGPYSTFATVTKAKSSDPEATYPAKHYYGGNPSGSADPVESATVTVVPVPKYGGEKGYYSAGSKTSSKDHVAPNSVSTPVYHGEDGTVTTETTVRTTVTVTRSHEASTDPITTSTASGEKYGAYPVVSYSKDPETTCTEEASSTDPVEHGYSVHTTSSTDPVSSTTGYPVYYATQDTKTSSADPVTPTTTKDYGYHTYSILTEASSTDPVTSSTAEDYGYHTYSFPTEASYTEPVTSTTIGDYGYHTYSIPTEVSYTDPVTSTTIPEYGYEIHTTSSTDSVTSTTTKDYGYKVYTTSSTDPVTSTTTKDYGYEIHTTSSTDPVTSTTTKDYGYEVHTTSSTDPITSKTTKDYGYEIRTTSPPPPSSTQTTGRLPPLPRRRRRPLLQLPPP
jgi:hypothetical protein